MTHAQSEAADELDPTESGEPVAKSTLDVSLDEGFAAGNTLASRRRISSGTLIMGAVILASGASLWSMRAIDRAAASGPSVDKEFERLFESVKKNPGGATIETDASRLLDTTEGSTDVRVPLKDLAKNPFVIWRDPSAATEAPTEPAAVPGASIQERIAEWEAKVDAAAGAIKVQSTMESANGNGMANVNTHMMREGDVFAVDKTDIEFTIARIERNQLTVRAYNPELRHERLVIIKVNKKW
ncbi:MAG: hypothetical protein U0572_03405 [Phycisphaerales bacterium]